MITINNNPDFKWLPDNVAKIFLVLALVVMIVLGSGCASTGGGQAATPKELKLAPLSEMPDYVQTAPPQVQKAYRFAVANPDLLEQIPCYCGCGGMGHKNNLNCYVAAFASDGKVAEFDNHAAL